MLSQSTNQDIRRVMAVLHRDTILGYNSTLLSEELGVPERDLFAYAHGVVQRFQSLEPDHPCGLGVHLEMVRKVSSELLPKLAERVNWGSVKNPLMTAGALLVLKETNLPIYHILAGHAVGLHVGFLLCEDYKGLCESGVANIIFAWELNNRVEVEMGMTQK